jgi:cytochrome d ubiquinol oxidase subunit I
VGDTIARWLADNQPTKFAAMEVVTTSGSDQPEIILGRYDPATNTVSGGIRIPGLNSILTGGSRDTYVQGLDVVAPGDRPSNVNIVHWAFDTMVGVASLLVLLVLWFAVAYWRRRDVPRSKLFLWVAASAGVLCYIALEAGWIVTEVGRQPWIVYNMERTADAVTRAGGVWVSLVGVTVLYAALGAGTIIVLRAMSRRWRRQDEVDEAVPYGPRPIAEPAEVADP